MKMKVLVTVMTYPSLSKRHIETVCTAGFREDGSWIRIFPIPLRLLPTADDILPYHKWQWIEVDLEQDIMRDDRPESYHIYDIESLKPLERIDKGRKPSWGLRLEWVLRNKRVFTNMSDLLDLTKQNKVSLAVLKPREIIDVSVEPVSIDDNYREKLLKAKRKYYADMAKPKLFDEQMMKRNFIFAEKIPFRFKYVFTTDDGKKRNITIEDWEICQLFRNLRKNYDEQTACRMVREKYMKLAIETDTYFFMGTSFQWQRLNAKDPYLIIGVFFPPKQDELIPRLFE